MALFASRGLVENAQTPTMISREGSLNPAYYHSYNNLSYQRETLPKVSKAYFYDCPFSCDEHTIERRQFVNAWNWGTIRLL